MLCKLLEHVVEARREVKGFSVALAILKYKPPVSPQVPLAHFSIVALLFRLTYSTHSR